MATLSVQTWPADGSDPTLTAAAAGGDAVPNDGDTAVVVSNPSTGPADVRFKGTQFDRDSFARDVTYTLPAGAVRRFVRLEMNRFGGRAQVEYPGGVDPNGDGPLQIGAARHSGQAGQADDLPSPPALGASPGTWPTTSMEGGFDMDVDGATASVDGDRMPNDGDTVPWIRNATGATLRVWFHAQPSDHGYRNHVSEDIPNGSTQMLRALQLRTDRFGGRVPVTYSDTNDVALGDVSGVTILGVRNASY